MPNAGPAAEPRQDLGPRMRGWLRIVPRQPVDDPTEQERLGELRGGDRQIGDDERDRGAAFGTQQAERAGIDFDEGHAARFELTAADKTPLRCQDGAGFANAGYAAVRRAVFAGGSNGGRVPARSAGRLPCRRLRSASAWACAASISSSARRPSIGYMAMPTSIPPPAGRPSDSAATRDSRRRDRVEIAANGDQRQADENFAGLQDDSAVGRAQRLAQRVACPDHRVLGRGLDADRQDPERPRLHPRHFDGGLDPLRQAHRKPRIVEHVARQDTRRRRRLAGVVSDAIPAFARE